jgi:hypothetical protein
VPKITLLPTTTTKKNNSLERERSGEAVEKVPYEQFTQPLRSTLQKERVVVVAVAAKTGEERWRGAAPASIDFLHTHTDTPRYFLSLFLLLLYAQW